MCKVEVPNFRGTEWIHDVRTNDIERASPYLAEGFAWSGVCLCRMGETGVREANGHVYDGL